MHFSVCEKLRFHIYVTVRVNKQVFGKCSTCHRINKVRMNSENKSTLIAAKELHPLHCIEVDCTLYMLERQGTILNPDNIFSNICIKKTKENPNTILSCAVTVNGYPNTILSCVVTVNGYESKQACHPTSQRYSFYYPITRLVLTS